MIEMPLVDVHEVAYQILEQTERLPRVPKPDNDNTAWHMAYSGQLAYHYAYKAMHERDKWQANEYLTQAIKHIKQHKGEA